MCNDGDAVTVLNLIDSHLVRHGKSTKCKLKPGLHMLVLPFVLLACTWLARGAYGEGEAIPRRRTGCGGLHWRREYVP